MDNLEQHESPGAMLAEPVVITMMMTMITNRVYNSNWVGSDGDVAEDNDKKLIYSIIAVVLWTDISESVAFSTWGRGPELTGGARQAGEYGSLNNTLPVSVDVGLIKKYRWSFGYS